MDCYLSYFIIPYYYKKQCILGKKKTELLVNNYLNLPKDIFYNSYMVVGSYFAILINKSLGTKTYIFEQSPKDPYIFNL